MKHDGLPPRRIPGQLDFVETMPQRNVFELPSSAERLQYPFLDIDPELPAGDSLDSPFRARYLLGHDTKSSDFNNRTLQLLLHFGAKGNARRLLYETLMGKGPLKPQKLLQGLTVIDWGAGLEEEFIDAVRRLGGSAFGVDIKPPTSDPRHGLNHFLNDTIVEGKKEAGQQVSIIAATHFVDAHEMDFGTPTPGTAEDIEALLQPGGLLILVPRPPSGVTTDPCPRLPLEPSFGVQGKFVDPRPDHQSFIDNYEVRRKRVTT